MRLVWRAKARRDVREIIAFIADRSPAGAERIERIIAKAVETLVLYPFIHRPGRLPNTREAVVHPNYIIVYRVGTD